MEISIHQVCVFMLHAKQEEVVVWLFGPTNCRKRVPKLGCSIQTFPTWKQKSGKECNVSAYVLIVLEWTIVHQNYKIVTIQDLSSTNESVIYKFAGIWMSSYQKANPESWTKLDCHLKFKQQGEKLLPLVMY